MSNKVTIEIDRDVFYTMRYMLENQIMPAFKALQDADNKDTFDKLEAWNNFEHNSWPFCRCLVESMDSITYDDTPALPFVDEAPAEPAPKESELLSADNISSNDASNNDISSNDVLAEDVQEFPFPEVLETNQNDSIKERFVLLSLKDAEIEDLAGMCGVCGIPTNCMLESFVADLVGSENRNSIESMILARRWFDSTLFGQTYVCLLGFLLKEGYDPYDDLIRYLEDIKQGEYDLLDYDVNPLASEIDPEDIGYLREDLENWKEHVNKLRNEFQKTYRDAKWDEEVKYVIQWWEDKELFKTRFDKFVNNEFDK